MKITKEEYINFLYSGINKKPQDPKIIRTLDKIYGDHTKFFGFGRGLYGSWCFRNKVNPFTSDFIPQAAEESWEKIQNTSGYLWIPNYRGFRA